MDESTRGWRERPPLLAARGGHDVATINGHIFVVGGFGATELLDSVETRDVRGDGRWRPVAPMHTRRANPAAAGLDGMVYVAGGIAFDESLVDAVERYDPRAGSWQPLPALKDPRGAASAAGLGGRLYVAGGLLGTDDTATDSVVSFDPRQKSWRPVAPMLTPRARHRLVALQGHLYAIGGVSNATDPALPTVERYSPASDKWQLVKPMHEGRGLPGAGVITDGARQVIVVVGGSSRLLGGVRLSSSEVYDANADRWRPLRARLPHATTTLVSAQDSAGGILAIGGSPDAGGIPSIIGEKITHKVLSLTIAGDGRSD